MFQIEVGFDRLQLHQAQIAIVIADQVDASVCQRAPGGRQHLFGQGDGLGRRVERRIGSAVLVLHPEIAALGALADGVAEDAAEIEQRQLTLAGDGFEERLDHRRTRRAIPQRLALLQPHGGEGAAGDLGLGDQARPKADVGPVDHLGRQEIGEQGRHDRNAPGIQLGQVALVGVPAHRFGGVDHRQVRGAQRLQPCVPGVQMLVVAPAQQGTDAVEAGEIVGRRPRSRLDRDGLGGEGAGQPVGPLVGDGGETGFVRRRRQEQQAQAHAARRFALARPLPIVRAAFKPDSPNS